MFCPRCGKENGPQTRFCVYCGAALSRPAGGPASARPLDALPVPSKAHPAVDSLPMAVPLPAERPRRAGRRTAVMVLSCIVLAGAGLAIWLLSPTADSPAPPEDPRRAAYELAKAYQALDDCERAAARYRIAAQEPGLRRQVLDDLCGTLRSGGPWHRATARRILEIVEPQWRTTTSGAALLDSLESEVRGGYSADEIRRLADLDGPRVVPHLLARVKSASEHFHMDRGSRRTALQLLGQIDPEWYRKPEGKAVLEHYLSQMMSDPRFCVWAESRLIGAMPRDVTFPTIIDTHLRTTYYYDKEAYAAIGQIDPDWRDGRTAQIVRERCLAALKSESGPAGRAAKLLAKLGDPAMVKPLVVALPHQRKCLGEIVTHLRRLDPDWVKLPEARAAVGAMAEALDGGGLYSNEGRVREAYEQIKAIIARENP